MTRTVTRTFDILQTISHHPEGIGVNEIARQTDLHKSTVSRLLITLESMDIVSRLEDGGGFAIGARLRQIASTDDTAVDWITITQPYLQALCTQIGEDIGLAVPHEDGVHFINQVFSEQTAVHVRDWTGTQYPYHVTSSGKLIMAFWPPEKLERYLAQPLQKFSEGTITNPQQLQQRLAQIRAERCDWTQGEFAEGFSAVSAPIFDEDGQVQAAINIYAPSYRFPNNQQDQITTQILHVAQQLTERLGGSWVGEE